MYDPLMPKLGSCHICAVFSRYYDLPCENDIAEEIELSWTNSRVSPGVMSVPCRGEAEGASP